MAEFPSIQILDPEFAPSGSPVWTRELQILSEAGARGDVPVWVNFGDCENPRPGHLFALDRHGNYGHWRIRIATLEDDVDLVHYTVGYECQGDLESETQDVQAECRGGAGLQPGQADWLASVMALYPRLPREEWFFGSASNLDEVFDFVDGQVTTLDRITLEAHNEIVANMQIAAQQHINAFIPP